MLRLPPTHRLLVVAAALAAMTAGCDRSPTAPDLPVLSGRDTVFTNEQLLQTAYSDYTLPPGFYAEPGSSPWPYYVNTLSIVDLHHQPPEPWSQLATEDVNEARAWAEASVANSNGVAPISPAAPTATERYFEFAPVPAPGLTAVTMRIHRSSYVTGVPWDGSTPSTALGTFRKRPIDSGQV